ncbi:MAG: hypothetical protein IIA90_04525 [Chloroflexi bacterium]|nr:hypothetical protein [Chloroflexota bacterium]
MILVIFVWPVVFVRDSGMTGAEFDRQTRETLLRVHEGYLEPVTQALDDAFTPCSGIDPATKPPECAPLVDTLRAGQSVLDSSIERLDDLMTEVPTDIPDDLLRTISATLILWNLLQERDQLLIDGWLSGDANSWAAGWEFDPNLSEINP